MGHAGGRGRGYAGDLKLMLPHGGGSLHWAIGGATFSRTVMLDRAVSASAQQPSYPNTREWHLSLPNPDSGTGSLDNRPAAFVLDLFKTNRQVASTKFTKQKMKQRKS